MACPPAEGMEADQHAGKLGKHSVMSVPYCNRAGLTISDLGAHISTFGRRGGQEAGRSQWFSKYGPRIPTLALTQNLLERQIWGA